MVKPIVLLGDGSITEFPGTRLRYYESFFSKKKAEKYFKQLKDEILWQQDYITVYGKTYSQPRLTALFGNNSNPYSYSGITMHPHQITTPLLEIQNCIQQISDIKFTTVLLNLYRNGSGSLLLMEGETQSQWLHQIAKTSRPVQPRINLTFRKII